MFWSFESFDFVKKNSTDGQTDSRHLALYKQLAVALKSKNPKKSKILWFFE